MARRLVTALLELECPKYRPDPHQELQTFNRTLYINSVCSTLLFCSDDKSFFNTCRCTQIHTHTLIIVRAHLQNISTHAYYYNPIPCNRDAAGTSVLFFFLLL